MANTVGDGSSSNPTDEVNLTGQDHLLPLASVSRIMKKILPANAKVSKEAKETMQECVSEFVSFVTSEALEKSKKERRKTVNGDDICSALRSLGFDEYLQPLKRYMQIYRETEGLGANQKDEVNEEKDETTPTSWPQN